jgi:hypothetical protein
VGVVTLHGEPGRVRGVVALPAGFDAARFAQVAVRARRGADVAAQVAPDAAGAFVIPALPAGAYTISVVLAGADPLDVPVTVEVGQTHDVGRLALTVTRLEAAVTGTARLQGVVDVRGHGGIRVESQGTPFTTVTTEAGQFTLDVTPRPAHARLLVPGVRPADGGRGAGARRSARARPRRRGGAARAARLDLRLRRPRSLRHRGPPAGRRRRDPDRRERPRRPRAARRGRALRRAGHRRRRLHRAGLGRGVWQSVARGDRARRGAPWPSDTSTSRTSRRRPKPWHSQARCGSATDATPTGHRCVCASPTPISPSRRSRRTRPGASSCSSPRTRITASPCSAPATSTPC